MDAATKYTTHTYKCLATNGGTRIFETTDTYSPFSPQIKVSQNIGRAKTKTKYWVSEQDEFGAYAQPTTAMFAISKKGWYYGDLNNKKHLVIFQYSHTGEAIRTFYFKDFYPKNAKIFVNNLVK